ncbi:MAG: hypothetical protein ACRDZY_08585, partial [Acidimicrobiales bacterium]
MRAAPTELASLSGTDVLRTADVSEAREHTRLRRYRRLAVLLALIAAPVLVRAAISVDEALRGRPVSTSWFGWH